MEEMKKKNKKSMMMMTPGSSPENPRNEPFTTSTCPAWKLYENPFYNSPHQPPHNHRCESDVQNLTVQNCVHQHRQSNDQNLTVQDCVYQKNNLQCLHLPLSARKLAASFWDLTFFRPVMESELDVARAQIFELKTELDYERKARKKLESMNKRLAKELAEERRGREAMETMCGELAKEISIDKAEISTMKREIEEERKMMRMSEVLREERVQMKLAEAKIVLEEKLMELECSKRIIAESCSTTILSKSRENDQVSSGGISGTASRAVASFSGKFRQFVMGEKWVHSNDDNNSHDRNNHNMSSSACTTTEDVSDPSVLSENHNKPGGNSENANLGGSVSSSSSSSSSSSVPIFPRKLVSPETENPHIKRGIKGFVEFPRVVRAIGSKNRQWGTKLECQKAQLRILLKQKSPIRSNTLITS